MAHLYTAALLTMISLVVFVRNRDTAATRQMGEAALFGGVGVYVGGILANWGTVMIPADLFGLAGISLTLAGLYANRFQAGRRLWLVAAAIATGFLTLAAILGSVPMAHDEPVRTLLKLHIGFILTAAGFLLCLGLMSVVYVIKERGLRLNPAGLAQRLPSLDRLDRLQLRTLQAGFVLLSVGISFGLQMLVTAESGSARTDLLGAITLVVWGLMGMTLYLRLWRGWRGHRLALISSGMVCGLIIVVSLTFGFDIGMHGGR